MRASTETDDPGVSDDGASLPKHRGTAFGMSTRPVGSMNAAPLLLDPESNSSELKPKKRRSCLNVIKSMGPGLMVCLADTDGGCLVTAAQSGAQYKYSLVLSQLILIPILYWAQELTVRLSILTGKGLTELVRDQFGARWAWVAAIMLMVTCLGAIISEMSSIAGAFQMFGVPKWASCLTVLLVLCLIVLSGSYKKVELIGVIFGAVELIFFYTMFAARPDGAELWKGLWTFHFEDGQWMGLLTANIGAVIMPWMLYYQQSAICDKRLEARSKKDAGATATSTVDTEDEADELFYERADTAFGAGLTQVVMSAMVITVAATRSKKIDEIADIALALNGTLGEVPAQIVVTAGLTGASMVAALVVSLCCAWAVAEALGKPRSLSLPLKEGVCFYGVYLLVCIVGLVVTVSGASIVHMNIAIEVLNGVFMVPVICALFVLATKKGLLPEEHRVKGWYAWMIGTVFVVISVVSIYGAVLTLIPS